MPSSTSGRKTARSVSPSRATPASSSAQKPVKKRVATPRPKKEVASTPHSTAGSDKKKKKIVSKKAEETDDDEEVAGVVMTKEVEEYFNLFLLDMLADSSALHNVLRVQYLQCYVMGLILLASSFTPAVTPLPMFVGASNLVQGVAGCLGLAQAFSLTAAAQTSYSAMKKALQYNMFFHLLFAFIVIVHQDPKVQMNTQLVVAVSCSNVGINMWACYFRETTIDITEEAEELDVE